MTAKSPEVHTVTVVLLTIRINFIAADSEPIENVVSQEATLFQVLPHLSMAACAIRRLQTVERVKNRAVIDLTSGQSTIQPICR
jgi:hypothetical protein